MVARVSIDMMIVPGSTSVRLRGRDSARVIDGLGCSCRCVVVHVVMSFRASTMEPFCCRGDVDGVDRFRVFVMVLAVRVPHVELPCEPSARVFESAARVSAEGGCAASSWDLDWDELASPSKVAVGGAITGVVRIPSKGMGFCVDTGIDL